MIIIENRHITQIAERTKNEYNWLTCGAILGFIKNNQHIVKAILKLENEINEKKEKGFLISADQYIKAEKYADENRLQLMGFYYSSPSDLIGEPETRFAIAGLIYLSVLIKEKKMHVTAWSMDDKLKKISLEKVNIKPEVYDITTELALAV
jgi:proteasome lid subunit RPN8/RPN11